MSDTDSPQHDRRIQSVVYDLDKKVHALELSDATNKMEVAYLKGEVAGIRSSTASSFEVQAASKLMTQTVDAVANDLKHDNVLTNQRLDVLSKDLGQLRALLIWGAVTLVAAIVAAIQFKIVLVP